MSTAKETLHQMYRRHDDAFNEISRKAYEASGRYEGLQEARRAVAALKDGGVPNPALRVLDELVSDAMRTYWHLADQRTAMHARHMAEEKARHEQEAASRA